MPTFNMTFTYEYLAKTKRYFFSNEISNDVTMIENLASIQASPDDSNTQYTAGIAFADTNTFSNYKSFDFHQKNVVVSRVREATTTNDNRVFTLKYGAWFSSQNPTVVVVNNTTNSETSTTDFISLSSEGKIIMDDEISDSENVLVTIPQDTDFKLATELSSYEDSIDLSDIGVMWNNDERILSATTTDKLPTAANAYISPTSPEGGNALYANYILYDRYGNYIKGDGLSLGTKVYWYKNGSLQSAYEDILRIPSGAVRSGAAWHFTVTPHDSVRAGNIVTSSAVTIALGKPVASSVLITPSTATTTNDLVLTYDYDSPDGRDESGTELRWYLNGTIQTQYNGRISIFSTETSSGQQWRATVRPYDGYTFGDMVQSNTVVIDHSPPTLGNSLALYPSSPDTNDDLYVEYNFSSAEGADEFGPFPNWEAEHPDEDYPSTATIVRWYKNNVLQTSLNNYLDASNTLTSAGDSWHVEVTPGDGTARGVRATSSSTVIS